ncbi:hypothetical protein [Bradyrhizobium erythrophlei]|uniref:Uncharacterized protein n=1 Tax=Bradyrhizobium erythrophlei TaxID=1437360 RepID=A0A1M5UIM9_9BRAD|nr:hypothetical protein [Bradyrhizobium erythrophlei]SHH62865.1 hypothetical protein SAMN05443248_5462 [Bradyrhizobium erythrophlei]
MAAFGGLKLGLSFILLLTGKSALNHGEPAAEIFHDPRKFKPVGEANKNYDRGNDKRSKNRRWSRPADANVNKGDDCENVYEALFVEVCPALKKLIFKNGSLVVYFAYASSGISR